MIVKYVLSGLFILLIFYSLIRPFSGLMPRIFLFSGSLLGLLSVLGVEYTDSVANFLGIGRGADLYLYLSLVTIFIFIFYSFDKFKSIENKIIKLTRIIALKDIDKN
jgi:small membrane protein